MADRGGSSPADPYIGSLISLTSKSEIRYEGLLYTVDTENSNIALQNVRSFGTEGRKKDGPQIPASDKVYEFIIFRGTDIKDLQVKMSPPPIHNDPAIISLQAQTSQSPSAAPPYFPPVADLIGQHSTYKASPVPFYHAPSSGMPLWAPPPPPQGPGGNIPLYWQGFYRPPEQHLLMETPAASAAPSIPAQVLSTPMTPAAQAPVVLSGQDHASVHPAIASTSTLSPPSHTTRSSELRKRGSSMVPGTDPVHSTLSGPGASLPVSSLSLSSPNAVSGELLSEGMTLLLPSKLDEAKVQINGDSESVEASEALRPSSSSSASTTQKGSFTPGKGPMVYKQVYKQVQPTKEPLNSGHRVPASNLQQPSAQPLLPLPVSSPQHKPVLQVHEGYPRTPPMRRGGSRGGGMGRPSRSGQSRSNLLEEFDFIAMNEKFKKEEVWDELLKVESKDTVCEENRAIQVVDYGAETDENGAIFDGTSSDLMKRSVYVKDDFFDSLSCDALEQREHGNRQDRVKFLEQRKIDVETFGTYHVRSYRGGDGGYRGKRGGFRGRGSAGRSGHGYYNANRGNGRSKPAAPRSSSLLHIVLDR